MLDIHTFLREGDTLALKVVEGLRVGGQGLMKRGDARCLRLNIIVDAESLVNVSTPDVLFQTGIVDEGVAVLLDAVNAFVALDLLLADGSCHAQRRSMVRAQGLKKG